MALLLERAYNPDVLSCLANLSNDEVFTPPEVANQMLDLLPPEIWKDRNIKILDPACKTGVFLREAAKRFIDAQIPNYQEIARGVNEKIRKGEELSEADKYFLHDLEAVTEHVYKNQLFGIAITEMTSLLSRRGVYCSKYPNSKYSVVEFDNPEGNIRFRDIKHTWGSNKKCIYCGAPKDLFDRDSSLESHAYELIHLNNPEEIFDMKFDVIVGNPPYQLNDGGNGASASPIYHKFIEQAIKLNPRYLTMIVPSRYLAGGKGLDAFRQRMLSDHHLIKMVDFINAKDCFPQNSVGGGVNYFLWSRDEERPCEFTTVANGRRDTMVRYLDEFSSFVRRNQAVSIIKKILDKTTNSFSERLSSRNPFGLPTSTRGLDENKVGYLKMLSSKGFSYIELDKVASGEQYIDEFKILISRITYEHAGEPDKDGKLRVLSRVKILNPGTVCTDSYLIATGFTDANQVENCANYLSSKFVRFLIAQTLTSINLSKDKFVFVPDQDFGSGSFDDESLYKKYGLDVEEIEFIEANIHEMSYEAEDD
ncbi:Eco57I restriction-modification methylase domain-containing protein [Bifidobacterium magnum]|uniref:site-specific DNA-methyltransferase (adenine-specific) n=1 Tax=Bifidobacterium magnum TaxID=1692 RepID=A0A087B988_9BIFI|nr:Eco57I restriction-modification methylase domain-containing protein [Bifidobacterium magnum]KFI67588.1 putative Type IIG restriction enzyme/N6-adenine DNA methyltransferase of unknown recognition sequence [Bifidobacterium magnum]